VTFIGAEVGAFWAGNMYVSLHILLREGVPARDRICKEELASIKIGQRHRFTAIKVRCYVRSHCNVSIAADDDKIVTSTGSNPSVCQNYTLCRGSTE
jgi:hypothetical protein